MWVFGLVDVHTGIGIIRVVPNRNGATLLPIIQEVVLPGSTIHSDYWGAYMHGAIPAIPVNPPYIHHAVNHTRNFVCPLTGAHTNHVESFWSKMKMKFKAMSGTNRDMLPSYLDEHMWRQFNGKRADPNIIAFDNMVNQISEYYPVNG